ncbi:hypothetical protein [Halodesulfovibrio marinisediminis]|uniref:Uncharacterized protein n=1 Tax=Halodesulfovibrio marinisediminis DSM 17456 TaxID=1121457 RepID=A0A1N6IGR3_9BACT|nr:hypothetical protein [Halodesulfovibrio marinisediminis]SIO31191.1 hypothetical protein SAMN02745161_2737 [Halodesulfovibrio marinisediminis DSM 17456]
MQGVFMFLEKSFTAATFAEAGFHSTARDIAKLSQPADGWLEDHMISAAMAEGDWASRIEREKATTVFDVMDNLFVPMTYAEAGHLDTARQLMGKKESLAEPEQQEFMSFMETVGLRQDQVRYGLVTI